MTDECLIVVWHVLLCIVVPHFDEVILTSGQHVATVVRKVSRSDGASVHSREISEVHAFVAGQAIDSDALIFGDNDDLTVVLGKLEAADDGTD